MARMNRDDRLRGVHTLALDQFNRCQTTMRPEREQCLADRRFYSIAGAMWEGPLAEQFENKPKLEVNKVHLSVIRIINEYRNNRIAVTFVPKDGSDNDGLSDVCNGLFRADEQDSTAQEAYDNAFEEAVGGGFGAWRLRTEYVDESDEDDDRQRIVIDPIFDADTSVYFDMNAKRQDKADAKHCFVVYSIVRSSYVAEWGDDPASWPKETGQRWFDWATPDVVYIAEYYVIEEKRERVSFWQSLTGEEIRYTQTDFDNDEMLEETLLATGWQETRSKRVKRKRCHKYIMSGGGILEDCGYIAGPNIPIIPVFGKRWFVDNVERCMGHVRLAKDSQRIKNMQVSKLAEISALSSVAKPILMPEQVVGHMQMWAEDNIKNFPYLLINPITDATGATVASGPVAYTKPAEMPQPMAALLQLTDQDMREILGSQGEADKMVSNISGVAVEAIQTRLDMQSFIYMSNFAKGARRAGEVWLGMAKEVYVEPGRKIKAVGDQLQISSVELMRPISGEGGELKYENDISEADFDCKVDVGPSSNSRREATVRTLTNMIAISDDPETRRVLQAMAMLNIEGEGVADVREYFRRKLLYMGVLKPTEEEAKELREAAANQPPDANAQFLAASAEEAIAKAAQARATTVKTIADAEQSRAKTAEIISNIDIDEQDHVLRVTETLGDMVQSSLQ